VTVEYLIADGTLDGYIAQLLEAKLKLVNAVESDEVPTHRSSKTSRPP